MLYELICVKLTSRVKRGPEMIYVLVFPSADNDWQLCAKPAVLWLAGWCCGTESRSVWPSHSFKISLQQQWRVVVVICLSALKTVTRLLYDKWHRGTSLQWQMTQTWVDHWHLWDDRLTWTGLWLQSSGAWRLAYGWSEALYVQPGWAVFSPEGLSELDKV